MIVYKYLMPDRHDVLENCRIRFTQPLALNDPFEALPCLTQYNEQVSRPVFENPVISNHPDRDKIVQRVKADIGDWLIETLSEVFVFLSVSKKRDHLLMWSHYALEHRGFVIGFDSEHTMFQPGMMCEDGLREVKYTNERWILPPDGLESVLEADLGDANAKLIFTKSADWKYEEELRLVARTDMANDASKKDTNGFPIYLFDFSPEIVKEVILGCRMSDENRNRVIRIAKKLPNVTLFGAKPDERHFALKIEQINP